MCQRALTGHEHNTHTQKSRDTVFDVRAHVSPEKQEPRVLHDVQTTHNAGATHKTNTHTHIKRGISAPGRLLNSSYYCTSTTALHMKWLVHGSQSSFNKVVPAAKLDQRINAMRLRPTHTTVLRGAHNKNPCVFLLTIDFQPYR